MAWQRWIDEQTARLSVLLADTVGDLYRHTWCRRSYAAKTAMHMSGKV
jgi:hypothetical protein